MNEVAGWREAPSAQFAVIGSPVRHSLSPTMHEAAFRSLQLPYCYVAIEVAPGDVHSALDHLANAGYLGVNVTVPHKEEAVAWAERVEPIARRAGAANTVDLRKRSCTNTDASGFIDTLDALGVGGKRALLIGAGGSARSIAIALEENGFELTITNRTRARAEQLLIETEVRASILDRPKVEGFDLVVNTTSVALQGEMLLIDWSRPNPGALAYELMYAKERTTFLAQANDNGLRTVDGLPLLVAQGARSLEYWLGIEAPRAAMAEAVGCES